MYVCIPCESGEKTIFIRTKWILIKFLFIFIKKIENESTFKSNFELLNKLKLKLLENKMR